MSQRTADLIFMTPQIEKLTFIGLLGLMKMDEGFADGNKADSIFIP